MANIHTQVIEGKLAVTHEGQTETFDMPVWMKALGKDGILQDADKILMVLEENDILLGFLHAGLKECLVGLRAHIRPKEGVSILNDYGLPETYRPKAQDVPGTTGKKVTPQAAIEALKATGMSIEDIMAMIQEAK